MNKYLQIELEDGQIDRYSIINISINDFIDYWIQPALIGKIPKWKEISKEIFETDKKFHIEFNIEDLFELHHYVYRHTSKENRNEWNKLVRQFNRD